MTDVSVLYIMGQDRSGSTVMGGLLGSIDGFVHVGELRQLWFEGYIVGARCGCGRPTIECPFWSEVVAEAGVPGPSEANDVVALGRKVLRLRRLGSILARRWTPDVERWAGLFASLYRALARHTGARVIVDSSKHPVQAAVLAGMTGLDVRFVHLVRDPRAVAYSWQRDKRDPGRGREERMWRASARSAAQAWILSNLAADRVRRRVREERARLVRYEDFVGRPASIIRAVASLAGVRAPEVPLEDERTGVMVPSHSVAGNPARFRTGPVELREDDEWRARQPGSQRGVVTAMTLPLLRRYGYPIRAGRAGPERT